MRFTTGIRRAWQVSVRVLAGVLLYAAGSAGLDVPVQEYELKAAFLLNFVKFVQWPETAFAGARAPIVVCVLRHNPFGETLARLVAEETVNGRPLVVRQLSTPDDVPGCHVVFVSRMVLAEDGDAAVPEAVGLLTVGEAEGFLARGGIISFYTEGDRIRFAVNRDAAERSRLQLSARLLRVARVVRAPRGSRL